MSRCQLSSPVDIYPLRPGNESSSVSIPSPPSLITQTLTGKSLPAPPSFAPDLLCRDPFRNFFPFLLPSLILYPFPPLSHATNDASLPFQPGLGGGGGSTRKEAKGRGRGEERDKSHKFLALPPPFFLLSLIPLFVAPRGGREDIHPIPHPFRRGREDLELTSEERGGGTALLILSDPLFPLLPSRLPVG